MKTFTLLAVVGAVLSVSLVAYNLLAKRTRENKMDMTNYVAVAAIFTAIMATLAVNLK